MGARTAFLGTLLAAAVAGCSADPEIDALVQEQVVCARGGTLPGIDVSFWQGTINWDQVRASGQRYAIIRAYYGANTRDTQFDRNWREARRVGLIRGAYQWFKPLQDPMLQADRMVAAVGRLGPGDLPVVADVEEPTADGIPAPAEYVRRLRVWYDRVRAGTGRAPIIYSGKYYWEPYLRSTAFSSTPLWHPQYTSAMCPNIANQWTNWTFWQYSSTGRVSGISGNVDMNRFNGTMTELNALAGIVPAGMDAGTVRDAAVDVAVDRVVADRVVADVAADRAVADVVRDVAADRAPPDAAVDVAPDLPPDAAEPPEDVAAPDAGPPAEDVPPPEDTPPLDDASVDDDVVDDTGEMPPVGDDTGGCGCSAPGTSSSRTAGLWALGMVALASRRRRSRR